MRFQSWFFLSSHLHIYWAQHSLFVLEFLPIQQLCQGISYQWRCRNQKEKITDIYVCYWNPIWQVNIIVDNLLDSRQEKRGQKGEWNIVFLCQAGPSNKPVLFLPPLNPSFQLNKYSFPIRNNYRHFAAQPSLPTYYVVSIITNFL